MNYVIVGLPESHLFAQAYSSSTYGGGVYNQGLTTTGTSATGSGSGTLANTGFMVILAVTAGVIIIFMALVVRLMHKTKKRSVRDDGLSASSS